MKPAVLPGKSSVDEKEVFARTPMQIGNESCDSCGTQSSPARYVADNGSGSKLFFCAHHTRKFAGGLQNQGFLISPPDFSFAAAQK